MLAFFGVFAWLAWRQTCGDLAAFAFGLMVVAGMQTFSGAFREAYPVSHFLLVALYGLLMSALGQGRGGWPVDAAAAALVVVAAMTLESGLVLAVLAVAGYAAGWRGISRTGLAAIAIVIGGYLALRMGVLHMHSAAVGDWQTGWGVAVLSTSELTARFGGNPLALYAYTVVPSVVSMLLSQPSHGQWTVLDSAQRGEFPPVFLLEMGTSVATTCLIGYYLRRPGAEGRCRSCS